MLKQYLQFKLSQKLSPQQIQLMKLIQLPTQAFEQRLKQEIEENPALESGKDEADRFEKINPGVRRAEEMITGPAKTMKNKPIRTMITNVFENVQSKADDMFGAAQDIAGDIAKQEDKLKFITKEVAEKLPKLAIGGIDLIRKIGFAMLFGGPSTLGADLIPEPILKEMMRDLGVTQEVPEAAKGGMMNINDITEPVGV